MAVLATSPLEKDPRAGKDSQSVHNHLFVGFSKRPGPNRAKEGKLSTARNRTPH
jgi:hypothetical protein